MAFRAILQCAHNIFVISYMIQHYVTHDEDYIYYTKANSSTTSTYSILSSVAIPTVSTFYYRHFDTLHEHIDVSMS